MLNLCKKTTCYNEFGKIRLELPQIQLSHTAWTCWEYQYNHCKFCTNWFVALSCSSNIRYFLCPYCRRQLQTNMAVRLCDVASLLRSGSWAAEPWTGVCGIFLKFCRLLFFSMLQECWGHTKHLNFSFGIRIILTFNLLWYGHH